MNIRRIVFLNCFWLAAGEIFTFMSDVENLISTEESLLELLDGYILSREEDIHQLKRVADDFNREVTIVRSHASQLYMPNPVNAFKVIRRLVRDWNVIRLLITGFGAQDEVRRKWRDIERTMVYPKEEDIEKASATLIRFQDVYNINSTSLASGEVVGVRNGSELTATDCYELGEYSYSQLDYQRSTRWFHEALARHKIDDGGHINKTGLTYHENSLEWKIYDFLPLSIFNEGEKERALNLTKEIISEFEEHEGAWDSQELMKKAMEGTKRKAEVEPENEKKFLKYMIKRYESLCRGAVPRNLSDLSKLKCRYVTTSPFTKLARLQEEEAFLNPRIVVFRNGIHDSEIENIKQLVTPEVHVMLGHNCICDRIRYKELPQNSIK